ncbi:MAG: hypothetical protein HYS23_04400 [Geobacter sp.]|nr:hypothetical protein [Geobacter sp.]
MKEEARKALEIICDLTEAGLDQVFVDGFLRDVPVIGTAYKIAELGKSISDRIFVTKLARFFKCIEDIPKNEIEDFCRKVDEGGISLQRLGENLVLAINRVNDMDKMPILGLVFRAYIEGKITYDQFQRIYAAVDGAVISDLRAFIASDAKADDPTFSCLINTGFTAISRRAVSGHGDFIPLRVEKTDLGETFRQVMSGNEQRVSP